MWAQTVLLMTFGAVLGEQAGASPFYADPVGGRLTATTAPLFDLAWDAPAECPNRESVSSDVLRLVGIQAVSPRRLRAQVTIRWDVITRWTLTLATDIDGVTGERILSGNSCQSVSDAAAMTLALVLNPESSMGPSAPSQPDVSKGRQQAGSIQPWLVGVHAGLQTGVLKDWSPGFALSLGFATGRFALRLVPGFTPEQTVLLDGRTNVGGKIWAGTASLLGCWTLLEGHAMLAPCLGYDLVMAHGYGVGVLHPREQTVYWSSAEVGLVTGVHITHNVSIELFGMGLLALNRPGFYLDNIGRVTHPARFGLRGAVALELAF